MSSFKPEQLICGPEPIRRFSTLAKDSSFYAVDNAVGELSVGKDVAHPKDSSFYDDSCDVQIVQSDLVTTTRKRRAPVKSTINIVKSIDAKKLSVYDFDGSGDDEPVAKKRRRRPRGLVPAQPRKRAKPAAFPRVKLPSVGRREKKFTVRAKIPVGQSAKVLNEKNLDDINPLAITSSNAKVNQMPSAGLLVKHANDGAARKRALRQRKNTSSTVITSGMDKLGVAVKTHLLVRQQSNGKKDSPKNTTHDVNVVRESDFELTR